MNNILFITAFKDIGRKNWKSHTRSNEDYYYYFLLLSKNIDYTLEQVVERGGKPRDIILLKNSSFKKLFTILNNKKSKKICDYIIIIEEYINRYKDSIIKSLKIIN